MWLTSKLSPPSLTFIQLLHALSVLPSYNEDNDAFVVSTQYSDLVWTLAHIVTKIQTRCSSLITTENPIKIHWNRNNQIRSSYLEFTVNGVDNSHVTLLSFIRILQFGILVTQFSVRWLEWKCTIYRRQFGHKSENLHK